MNRRQHIALLGGLGLTAIGSYKIAHASNPITYQQLQAWAGSYAASLAPGMGAQTAFGFWCATGPTREVPQLNVLTFNQLGHLFNTINLSLAYDVGSQFRDMASNLGFFNDLISNGDRDREYLAPCLVLIYFDRGTKKVEPFVP